MRQCRHQLRSSAPFFSRVVDAPSLQDGQPARHAIAKTSNLNEELGRVRAKLNYSKPFTSILLQVEMVFSDKTGTLTRNEMTFRFASVRGERLSEGGNNIDIGNLVREPAMLFVPLTACMLITMAQSANSPTLRFMQVLVLCHSLVPCVDATTGEVCNVV